MRLCVSLLVALALGAAACGDNDEPTGPTAPSGCTLPSSPANFAVALAGSSAVFSWSAVSGANDYVIRIGSTPGSGNMVSTNTTQTTFTWNGTGRGTYYATVEARNACGGGPVSNTLTFTTT